MARPTGGVVIQGNFKANNGTVWNITASNGLQIYDLASGEKGSIESMVSRNSDGSISIKIPAEGLPAGLITGEVAPAGRDECVSMSSQVPSETTWPSGACKISTLVDTTITCNGKPTPPVVPTATVCACPGGILLSSQGAGDPCAAHKTFQKDLQVTTNGCPSTSALPTIPAVSGNPEAGRSPRTTVVIKTENVFALRNLQPTSKPLAEKSARALKDSGSTLASSTGNFSTSRTPTPPYLTSFPSSSRISLSNLSTMSNLSTIGLSRNESAPDPSIIPSATRKCTAAPHTTGPAMYTLTIVAEIPCDKPIAQTCSPTHQPDFTVDQWKAYSVDQFWAGYVQSHQNGSLMVNFWNKYIGVGQDQVACSADGLSHQCVLDDPCDTIKASPVEKVQAMLVSMAMINFASLIAQVYATLNTVQSDMLEGGLTAAWVNAFEPDPKQPSTAWQHIMEIMSGFIVFIASFIIFFDPAWAPEAIGLMIGASTIFGMAGNAGPLFDPPAETDFKLDAIENNTVVVENYVVTNQKMLSQVFEAYYDTGKAGNQTTADLFSGGAWVGPVPEPDPMFAKNGSDRMLATYLENIVIAGLSNTWMKQTVYMLFIPYGTLYNVSSKGPPEPPVPFMQADCEKLYISPLAHSGLFGSCTMGDPIKGEGMSVFLNSGSQQPATWYNREFTYPYGGYKYDPLEVMQSSLTGYLYHGFDYNATQNIVSMLVTDHQNNATQQAITSLQPKTPGMFNIPVCRIADLKALPVGGGKDEQHIARTCLSDAANYTDPQTGKVTFFRDSINQDILTEMQNANR